MKNLLKTFSMLLAIATMTSFAFAQPGSNILDDIRDDATSIIVQSSQLKGAVTSLSNKRQNNHPNLAFYENDFNVAYSNLESSVDILNERIANSGDKSGPNEVLASYSANLIQHMILMSDDKSAFDSGIQGSGNVLKNKLQGLIKLDQDIRAEVMAMKNSSN